ncbi:MAG: tetratricopeptide repeat protein [Woeseiaceae bacterium]
MSGLFEELQRRNVVRVVIAYLTAAWLVAQLVTVLGDLVELPDWVGPVLLIVLIIGFFVAATLAWFYELTGEGLKTEAQIKSDPSLRRVPDSYLNYTIIALLTIALGYFIWESRFRADTGTGLETMSVAVMPFEDLSAAGDHSWFAAGMTDELMNALVRIPGLSIAGRRSVQRFESSKQRLSEFAESIGVTHVLEGSIRTAENRMRVSAQLVRVSDGFNVWSAVYDEPVADVFAVQDRIADGVIDGLQVHILEADRPVSMALTESETGFESYKLYLQGRYHMARRTPDDLDEAIRYFEGSLQADPQRSRTHSALAAVYVVMPYYGARRAPDEMAAAARFHANAALRSDARNAEAHSILGVLHMTRDRDWDKAKAAFEAAYQLAPGSADVANLYGDFLYAIGDYASAERTEGRAARLDPLSAVNQLELGLTHAFLGDFEKSIRQSELAIKLDEKLPNAWWQLFRSQFLAGNIGAAEQLVAENADSLGEAFAANARIMLAAQQGEYGKAKQLADTHAGTQIGQVSSFTKLAFLYALAQEDKTAAQYIEQAYATGDAILISPMYFFLPEDWRGMPEIQKALEKPGLRELFQLRRGFIAAGSGRSRTAIVGPMT